MPHDPLSRLPHRSDWKASKTFWTYVQYSLSIIKASVLSLEIILQEVVNKKNPNKLLTKAIQIFKLALWDQNIDYFQAKEHLFHWSKWPQANRSSLWQRGLTFWRLLKIRTPQRNTSSSGFYLFRLHGWSKLEARTETSYLEITSWWVCRMSTYMNIVPGADGLQFVDFTSL